ncbi:hypothetical protein BDW62DRAFT_203696 [Aspergillus aurantiobrunneus]
MDAKMLAERKSRRQKLSATDDALHQCNTRLSTSELKQLRIQRIPMTLSNKEGPEFFAQYSAPILEPELDTLDNYVTFDREPFRNARALAWFLGEYFENCELPDCDHCPRGFLFRLERFQLQRPV